MNMDPFDYLRLSYIFGQGEDLDCSSKLNYLGISSFNSVANLKTNALFLAIYITFALYALAIKVYLKCSKRSHPTLEERYKALKATLFFNFIIALSIETYPDFIIAGFLAFDEQNKDFQNPHTIISLIIGALGLFITLIILPSCTLWIIMFKTPAHLEQ